MTTGYSGSMVAVRFTTRTISKTRRFAARLTGLDGRGELRLRLVQFDRAVGGLALVAGLFGQVVFERLARGPQREVAHLDPTEQGAFEVGGFGGRDEVQRRLGRH